MPPKKKCKEESTPEISRMFDERFFYLDKTGTRYVITGLDPVTFQPTTKICDGNTGLHITIPTWENGLTFWYHCELLVEGVQPMNDYADITYERVHNTDDTVWKLTGKEGSGTVMLNKHNLQNILRFKVCMDHELLRQENMTRKYQDAIERIKQVLRCVTRYNPRLSDSEKMYEIYESHNCGGDAAEEELIYQTAFTIITGRSYLETLPMYADFYK